MMTKQFALSHSSKYDSEEGGILNYFEDKKHLAIFDKEAGDFEDISQKWIKDKNERKLVGEKAYEIVKKNHTWHNRAKKIINDLK